ncbi:uncharacterized protein KGF55_000882 [Candida pseudojiufengensis]|uniref:uncharacterized protein n=1 Tax=Candida pseudojiufengensis TaxID=497109 RepID=UPI0022255963|nr:uncharacterized protein KGF55_000882 [Candida pseudojiufengensis]KAI5966573.1 hypothetical protein KGF55_000882 [Candida pseudojiufengensis]
MSKPKVYNIFTTWFYVSEYDKGKANGYGGIGFCSEDIIVMNKAFHVAKSNRKSKQYKPMTEMRVSFWAIIKALELILKELNQNNYEGVSFRLYTDASNAIRKIQKTKKHFKECERNNKESGKAPKNSDSLVKIYNLTKEIRKKCDKGELRNFELQFKKQRDIKSFKLAKKWAKEAAVKQTTGKQTAKEEITEEQTTESETTEEETAEEETAEEEIAQEETTDEETPEEETSEEENAEKENYVVFND